MIPRDVDTQRTLIGGEWDGGGVGGSPEEFDFTLYDNLKILHSRGGLSLRTLMNIVRRPFSQFSLV